MMELETRGVVVVGAGPAGIVCALELAQKGIDVLLLDSGREWFDKSAQELGDLAEYCASRHACMSLATRRQLGGATNIWGGRCVPFDPIDFDERQYVPHSQWPITFDDVACYHEAASNYFCTGSAIFSTHAIPSIHQKTIVPHIRDDGIRSSDLERWSLPTNFRREYARAIKSNPRIKYVPGMTALRVKVQDASDVVLGIECANPEGKSVFVKGSQFVIACGGLETTRLLMQPTSTHPSGLGNEGGWLGKCYMGHLSGQIATVRFNGDPRKTHFGFLRDADGVYLRQRFTLSPEVQLANQINNTALWLVNPKIGDPSHGNGVLSFAFLALSSPAGKLFASEAIRQSAVADASAGASVRHLQNIAKDLPRTLAFIVTFGVKRFLVRRKVPGFFQYSKSNAYPLHYHAEHAPSVQSRVWLSEKADRLGMRMLSVDIRFSTQDIQSVIGSHAVLDRSLRRQNAGELLYHCDDLEDAVWRQASDGYHQAGTTRMASTSSLGVVDRNCKVFGTRNLYVASSSTFVTSGQANSTFLIVALALRLSDHLASHANTGQ